MVDIVIRDLSKEEYKQLKMLKLQRDSKNWADMFIALVHEWRNMKEIENETEREKREVL